MPLNKNHLTLSRKLVLSFGLVLLTLLLLTALALDRLGRVGHSLEEVAGTGSMRSQAVREMERSATRFGAVLRSLPTSPAETMDAQVRTLSDMLVAHKRSSQQARALITDSAELALVESAATAADAAGGIIAAARKESGERGEQAVAFSVRLLVSSDYAKWNERLAGWSQAVLKLSNWDDASSRKVSETSAQVAASARGALIGGAVLALVLSAGLAWWITRDVSAGLGLAVAAVRKMAQHDLATRVEVSRNDEIGVMLQALEDMRQRQHELASGVAEVARSISQASAEISSGSHDLSNRTELASVTLERVAGKIAALSSSVHETSDSAERANRLSGSANAVAEQGGRTVADAVATMAQIDAASGKIVDIIGMIDGVAFQTNILALNAAVEAARAGEDGRGFAVVAGEVRSLAQRTAKASREVKTLIEDARDKVAIGSKHVHLAGESTRQILHSVHDVSGIMSTISKGASEQLDDIGETRSAVAQLEAVVQQNAAMAEETAAATESLNEQVIRLSGLVGSFKLEHDVAPLG